MEGWIKVHRKIIKWEWYDDGNTFRLFLHLLLMAQHKDTRFRGHDLKRGQLLTGRKKLATALKLSEQQIRTSLKRLKSTNELTIESTSQHSIITIVNYDTYNDKDLESTNKSTNSTTNVQPTSNQRSTTCKNVKNEKNEKKTNKKRKPLEWVQLNPPTLDTIAAFFTEKGFVIDPATFYNHYTFHDNEEDCWRNKKGEQVKTWKGTANTWNGRKLEDIKKEKGDEYDAEAEKEGLTFTPRHLRNNNRDAYGRSILAL